MLGFIKDTASQEVLSTLGSETGGDGARLLFWEKGASRPSVIEYQGALKFNALLEWLESAIEGNTAMPNSEPEPETEASESKTTKAAQTANAEEAAARRAKMQAKLDEIERRDRLRREKLAAQRAAAEEANGGTPVEEPAAEPADVVGEEPTVQTGSGNPAHEEREIAEGSDEDGTPVDAPPAEPAEAADEQDWSFLNDGSGVPVERDEL